MLQPVLFHFATSYTYHYNTNFTNTQHRTFRVKAVDKTYNGFYLAKAISIAEWFSKILRSSGKNYHRAFSKI